jgi:hypothetical protein
LAVSGAVPGVYWFDFVRAEMAATAAARGTEMVEAPAALTAVVAAQRLLALLALAVSVPLQCPIACVVLHVTVVCWYESRLLDWVEMLVDSLWR